MAVVELKQTFEGNKNHPHLHHFKRKMQYYNLTHQHINSLNNNMELTISTNSSYLFDRNNYENKQNRYHTKLFEIKI